MRRVPAAAEALLLVLIFAVYLGGVGAYGMLTWDEAEYASLGRSLSRGEGYAVGGHPETFRLPVVPLAVAAVVRVLGTTADPAIRGAGAGLAVLTLAVVLLFARAESGRLTGAVAVVLCAFAPAYWVQTPHVMTDVAFTGFLTAAVWSFHRALERDERWMWASAGWAAAAAMTRYTAALFLPVALVLTVAAAVRSRRALDRLFSRHTAGAALAAVALLVPWYVRVHRLTGDPFEGLRWAGKQVQAYAPGVSFPWHFYLTSLPAMLSVPTVVALAVGAAIAIRSRDRFAIDSMLAAGSLLLYFSCFRYKDERFALAIVPLLAPVAAAGLVRGVSGLSGGRRPRLAVAFALAVVVPLSALPAVWVLATTTTNGYPSFLAAAEWIRRTTPPDAVILAENNPQVAWYCDRRTVRFDPAREKLAGTARGAALAVVTNFEPGQPGWVAALVDPARLPPGCEPRFFADDRFVTAVLPARCLVLE